MINTTEAFLSHFHSLTGITIGERRKHFFQLLNAIKPSTKDGQIPIDFSELQPRTPLEEMFKVDALIRFRKTPELIEIIKNSENPVLIHKILKASSWFLEAALNILDNKTFVQQFFPYISFNAKVKILNKLALHLKDARQGDEIFEAVQEKYGLYLATKLLPCCSANLIMQQLKLTKIEVTERQMLLMFERHPDLIEDILKVFGKCDNLTTKYWKIYRKILQDNLDLYLKLTEAYEYPGVCAGKRMTVKLVNSDRKKFIIENGKKFHRVLHKKQLWKCLRPDYGDFYLKTFPKSIARFYLKTALDDLRYLPNNSEKLNLLAATYEKCYGVSIWAEQPGNKLAKLLELLSSEERAEWMKNHDKPKDIPEDAWICLMKTEKSLPILKQKIAIASVVKDRAELVGCLVETCRINDDKAALTEVCKYMVTNHKNSHYSIVLCFFNTLKKCFTLSKLNQIQWQHLHNLLKTATARDQVGYNFSDFLYNHVQWCFENSVSEMEHFRDALKIAPNLGYFACFGRHKIDPAEKSRLLAFHELIPEAYEKDDRINRYLFFLYFVMKFNRQHTKNQVVLSSLKAALDATLENLNSDSPHYLISQIFPYLLRNLDQEPRWADAFFNKTSSLVSVELIQWFLKRFPLRVKENLESLMDATLSLWNTIVPDSLWLNFRNYAHLDIPQQIVGICLKIVTSTENGDDSDDDAKKRNAFTALSYLMPVPEFIKVVAPFYPTDLIMDVNDLENQNTYKLQQAITASLKNATPPSLVLESVSQFSKGDYLKFIQRSLYSVSHSVPETKLIPFFASLTDRPVSVRKHAIYLTLKVLDKTAIWKMLNQLTKTEKNTSIRKFLFQGAFRLFCKNPQEDLWNLVKENALVIDVNDMEAFDTFMETQKVPPGFRSQYVPFCWMVLERLPNVDDKVLKAKIRLIEFVDDSLMANLSDEFCKEIIERNLFKSDKYEDFDVSVQEFACKYLICADSDRKRQARMHWFVHRLQKIVEESRNKFDTVIRSFLNLFCRNFLAESCKQPKDALIKFAELWCNLFKPSEAFDHYLHLQMSLILSDRSSLFQNGEALAKLCDSCVFDPILICTFGSVFEAFCSHFLGENGEENRYDLIKVIMNTSRSQNCQILAVNLFPDKVPVVPKLKAVHREILREFKTNSPDPGVKLFLNCKYEQMVTETMTIANESDFHGEYGDKLKPVVNKMGGFYYIPAYESKYNIFITAP